MSDTLPVIAPPLPHEADPAVPVQTINYADPGGGGSSSEKALCLHCASWYGVAQNWHCAYRTAGTRRAA